MLLGILEDDEIFGSALVVARIVMMEIPILNFKGKEVQE